MHPADKVSSKLAAGAPKRETNKVSGGFSLLPLVSGRPSAPSPSATGPQCQVLHLKILSSPPTSMGK